MRKRRARCRLELGTLKYYKYKDNVGERTPAHSIYCSEFVWRSYRFGGGVTLVEPKEFLYFYDHPNRAITWLLWHGSVTDKERGEVVKKFENWNWLPRKILRAFMIKHFKTQYAGYILAPVQLAQSKFVEKVHRVPAQTGEEQVTVHSVHKKNIKPSEVAIALIGDRPVLRSLRHNKAMNDRMGDTSDDTKFEEWLVEDAKDTGRFDKWLKDHADEQKYTADSLDKPVG